MPPITKNQARGAAIAFARNLRGMTQQQLADAIGVSKNTQVRTEGGKRSIDVDELEDIAEALVWDLEWLMTPPIPNSVELGPLHDWDVPTAHNDDLSARRAAKGYGTVARRTIGPDPGPDDGTPLALPLPRAA